MALQDSNPTIAHEGNPRFTDDLVLVGTLDGTATLLPQFPPENPIPFPDDVPIVERPLPPGSGEPITVTQNTPDKFVFDSGFLFGNDAALATGITVTSSEKFIAPANTFTEYSRLDSKDKWGAFKRTCLFKSPGLTGKIDAGNPQEIDIETFLSSYWNAAGAFGSSLYASIYQAVSARLVSITGTPISGPAVAINQDSTYNSFQGYALLYNAVAQKMQLVFYDHKPLYTIPDIISSTSVLPTVGGYVEFLINSAEPANSLGCFLAWNMYDSSGVFIPGSSGSFEDGFDGSLPAITPHMQQHNYVGWVNVASGLNGSTNTKDYANWDKVVNYTSVTVS